MKSRVTLATIMLFTYLMLNGCSQSCAVGDPFSLFTYCPKDAREKLFNPKPYGAHWVKEGMTRESRREDSWACGAARTVVGAEHPVFPSDQLRAAKLPTDLNNILAHSRLTKVWAACMQSKGYVYQNPCDERCLHP
jgi:hypothetical protein